MNHLQTAFDDTILFEVDDIEPNPNELDDILGDLLVQEEPPTYDSQASMQANEDMYQDESFLDDSFLYDNADGMGE